MKLVLLPGLDGTGRLFSPLLDVLQSDFSPLIISYPADQFRSYAELSDYVRRQLPGAEDYVMLAESFSGPIAINLAADASPNLKALILCATFVSNPLPFGLNLSFLVRDWEFSVSAPEFLVRKFLIGQDAPQALWQAFRATLRTVAPKVLAARTRSLPRVDVREAFGRCRAPILYLAAKQDKLLKRSSLDEMRDIKPEMEVVEIDGPHLLLQRNPTECLKAIDQFVKRALS